MGNRPPESCFLVGDWDAQMGASKTPHISPLLCMAGARLVPRLALSVSLTNFDSYRGILGLLAFLF